MAKPLRVAVVNDLHHSGGAVGILAMRFVRALNEAGHDATLIAGVTDEAMPKDLPNLPFEYPERGNSMTLWDSTRFQARLTKAVKDAFLTWAEGGADLWVGLVPPSAHAVLSSQLGRSIPLIYMCNSPWGREYIVSCQDSGNEELSLMQRLGVTARRKVERRIVGHASCLMSLSETQKTWMEKEHPHHLRARYEIISGAVDENLWMPVAPKVAAKAKKKFVGRGDFPLLICSRRLVHRTGIDLLIDAMLELPPELRLAITGDGPLRGELENKVESLGLKKRVAFTGVLKREELRDLTCAADVAVVPTRALEGLGLAAVEAMACGTPVVATDVDELTYVVGDFDKHLLANEASASGIADAIRRVLETPSYFTDEFIYNSRMSALERYSWKAWSPIFVRTCTEVAAKAEKSR